MIWEEKGKSQGVDRVEDDEVVRDLDNGTTGHISCDNSLYTDRMSHNLASMWTM